MTRLQAIGIRIALCGLLLPGAAQASIERFGVQYVAEMAPLPLSLYEPLTYPCQLESRVLQKWPRIYSLVLAQVDDQTAVQLSRWAVNEMASYVYAPDLQATPTPYLCSSQFQVVEVIIQQLPSHSPIVVRWLKAFVVLDRDRTSTVREIILTVQGEVFE